ncbi:MAG: hypothetical protein BWZ10_02897 [candidate division BRC1 bacterium ADurb.BinA364]|nr:MAG: hypothetical protein BWZ10_02897 [candidate division BRC1 bacterium ADurb.BinA364]
MRWVAKMLVEIEALDDPEARKIFREMAAGIVEAVGERGKIRALKLVEEGEGRLLDTWDISGKT